MPQAATLRVDGYRDLLRALTAADKQTRRTLRNVIRHAGEATQAGAIRRISPIDTRSAAGYKVIVRQRGVSVEQSLRKTTRAHPEWGPYQMRHGLVPALDENKAETERRMELALDAVAAHFNTGAPR